MPRRAGTGNNGKLPATVLKKCDRLYRGGGYTQDSMVSPSGLMESMPGIVWRDKLG